MRKFLGKGNWGDFAMTDVGSNLYVVYIVFGVDSDLPLILKVTCSIFDLARDKTCIFVTISSWCNSIVMKNIF